MGSKNKGLFEEILADETLAGVAEYLYDNTDVTVDHRGNVVDYVDVPDIEFAENYAYISEEDYNKIAEAIREQAKNVRYYDGYILLNDNHTLHKIDNPEFDEYDYSTSVEDACEAFRLETGLSLYLLGRSGRRVCVEDSFSSFVNYDYLKEIQEKLENEVIAKHTVNESANEQVFYAVDTLGDSKENNRTYTQLQLYDFAKELIDIEEESSDKSQYKNRPKLTKNLNDIKAVLNWFNYEVKDAGMELTEDIDNTQFIIVGITKDGNRQFYNVSSAPHWVDDCDDATIFDDQAEAHKIFYEIDKKPFKRVFVPNFDRAALKEELDINKIDEDEFLTVTEQIASFLKGMDMDMDDVSGKITHYDVNMFSDCCEDRIRIKWTSYMNKNRVKSNSKILPAMLTQMMADDTRFDEVVDIFINEVDNEVIHHSDLGAISVEMIASDEFEPKTKAEEVKEAYVHARSEDDIREIDTGLTHKIDYIILGDVQGQLSDGIWENSPAMNKYWKHLDTEFKDGKVFIVVNNLGHMEDVYRGTRRDYRFLESPFRHMSDDEIKKWVANKIKQIAKHEAQDNDNAPEYAWRADNDTELEYFDSVVTVADAYRTWSKLLGRPVKNPINDIIIKTTPELEIGDVVNGKVLTEIKPDEKDNYWSYLVFENGDEQKVGKHQNHKVNKPTEETFNESVEDNLIEQVKTSKELNVGDIYVCPETGKQFEVLDIIGYDDYTLNLEVRDLETQEKSTVNIGINASWSIKESVYAEEPASRQEIEFELSNITHNFTDRQGTAKCSFKEEADIGYDILKQYYDKVRIEEHGEWCHLFYKDLLKLDESVKEDIGADDEVIIGLYGDEVSGFDSVDQLAKSFEDNGIEVISKSGDMEYGWDLEVKGNARDIYRLVNGKITGYNCNSTQEFVDRYRIDESKCTNESLLQDLQKDHKAIKDTYGQEVYDALNAYIENGNDLGDVLYKESEWNKFVDWAKKEKDIEIKSDVNESKSIKESKYSDKYLDSIRQKTQWYLEEHPYDNTFDAEDIASDVAENVFNVDYMTMNNEASYEILKAVEAYLDEQNLDESKSINESADSYDTINFNWSPNWIGGSLYQAAFITCHPNIDDDTYPYYWGKVYYKGPSFYVASGITEVSEEEADIVTEPLGRYYDVDSAKSSVEDWIKTKLNGIEIEEDDSEEDNNEENNNEEIDTKEIEDELLWRGMRGEYGNYEDTVAFKMTDKAKAMGMDHDDAQKLAWEVVSQMHDKRFDFEEGEALDESKSIRESKEKVKDILSRQLWNGKVKPFKDAKECPRGFAFKSSNGSSGEVSYRGKDYVFAIVDGELRVMTDAEAGWNWSETIYKK